MIVALAAQVAACSFAANAYRRPKPSGVWRDPAYAKHCKADMAALFGVPSLIMFLPYALSARQGYRGQRACFAERSKHLPDASAMAFTESARTLARRGDCAAANRLAEKARLADGRYYTAVTAADPDLKRCLSR